MPSSQRGCFVQARGRRRCPFLATHVNVQFFNIRERRAATKTTINAWTTQHTHARAQCKRRAVLITASRCVLENGRSRVRISQARRRAPQGHWLLGGHGTRAAVRARRGDARTQVRTLAAPAVIYTQRLFHVSALSLLHENMVKRMLNHALKL